MVSPELSARVLVDPHAEVSVSASCLSAFAHTLNPLAVLLNNSSGGHQW